MKSHLTLICAFSALASCAFEAAAADARIDRQLMKLDPLTRLEQACDLAVSNRISHDKQSMNVDKVIAYTFGEPIVEKNRIIAPGAALRSHGEWRRLQYDCRTEDNHVDIVDLNYKVGKKVPHEDWGRYFLYD